MSLINVFGRWYRRKFSDPDAAMLLILILLSVAVLVFWGSLIMPVLVAAVIAYLLDWPVVRLVNVGVGRTLACSMVMLGFVAVTILLLVGLVPTISRQSVNLIQETPLIWQNAQEWVLRLPDKYPDYVQVYQIQQMMEGFNDHMVEFGQTLLEVSVNSLGNVAAVLVYMILVPLMVFFMLKDKLFFLDNMSKLLPRERRLITQVGHEMNTQIANYIRGKVIEIVIVGGISCLTFAPMYGMSTDKPTSTPNKMA